MKKYLELLVHVDGDDSLFSLISEDRSLNLKFSQVERLLVQRLKLQRQATEDEAKRREQESQPATSQGTSLYSYFGFGGSNVNQDYLTATEADRSAVEATNSYSQLKNFYAQMYVQGYTTN